jgi:hypothetical protein
MIKLKDLLEFIERRVPFYLQEDWDRSGVWFAASEEISSIGVGLEIESFSPEEIESADAFIVHHPPYLRKEAPLPSLKNELLEILKNKNLIVCHTNADCARNSFVDLVLLKIGIEATEPAWPKMVCRFKIVTFIPPELKEKFLKAIVNGGFGRIGFYDGCSFEIVGKGHYLAVSGAHPFLGNLNDFETSDEIRIEFEVGRERLEEALQTIGKIHPYEEPVIEIYEIRRFYRGGGIGRVFGSDLKFEEFLKRLEDGGIPVKSFSKVSDRAGKIIFLPGSGRNFVNDVVKLRADTFVSGDLGYHERKDLGQFGINFVEIDHGIIEGYFAEWLANELKDYFGARLKIFCRR